MSQEVRMRELFEQLVGDEPPMTIHAGDIIYEGRRALRRRRLQMVSAGVLSAAAACALAVTAGTLTSGIRTGPRPAPPAAGTTPTTHPPGFPLPAASPGHADTLPERFVRLLPHPERARGAASSEDPAARSTFVMLEYDDGRGAATVSATVHRDRSPLTRPSCPFGSSRSCRVVFRPDGSYLLTDVQRAAGGLTYLAVYFRPDGTIVQVQASNGPVRAHGIDPTRPKPPIGLADLVRVATHLAV